VPGMGHRVIVRIKKHTVGAENTSIDDDNSSDFTINNNGTYEQLYAQLDSFVHNIQE
jgi:Na+-translocating ferredoxin:NAD+ oxidoreductase RnfG subunit